jgi:hypothetical protein
LKKGTAMTTQPTKETPETQDDGVPTQHSRAANTSPAYPRVGEVLELTLDFDAPANEPMEMVEEFGYNSTGWSYVGTKVTGRQTRRFKLVQIGYCSNTDKVRTKTAVLGATPEGQWINAFKAAYPVPDGQGPIGIADDSWIAADGRANYPYLLAVGFQHFNYGGHVRGEDWRWLVVVE